LKKEPETNQIWFLNHIWCIKRKGMQERKKLRRSENEKVGKKAGVRDGERGRRGEREKGRIGRGNWEFGLRLF